MKGKDGILICNQVELKFPQLLQKDDILSR